MKKSNFVALILGVVATTFFGLGMSMVMETRWGLYEQGIFCGWIGLAIALGDVLIWRRMEGKTTPHLNGKTLAGFGVGAAGAILFGAGMCLCLISEMMLPGIVAGMVGILLLICLIPLAKGLR